MAAHREGSGFGSDEAAVGREIDDELALHFELLVGELIAGGHSPEAARAEALRRFGDRELHADSCRRIQRRRLQSERRRGWLADLSSDLRFGLRELRRSPGYTAASVLTLGVAIGAATVVFSLLWAVALRPLPIPDPDSVVVLYEVHSSDGELNSVSPANFQDFRDQTRKEMAALAALDIGAYTLNGDGEPQRLRAALVTPSMFDVLGVRPALGRGFLAQESEVGAAKVAVLGDRLWRERFGADPAVIGRRLDLEGDTVEVVGVLPPGFDLPTPTDLWLPLVFDFNVASSRGAHYLWVMGRLAPGVSMAAAQARLDQVAAALAQEYPKTNEHQGVTLTSLRADLGGDARRTLTTLLGAIAVVLLIAVLNVMGLNIVRGLARGRELAVRGALGAGHGRLLRQLGAESLLLAAIGSVLALLVAKLGVRVVPGLLPAPLPHGGQVAVDGMVLAFLLGLSVLSGLVAGLWPALSALRASPGESLHGGRAGASRSSVRRRRLLVVVEVAAAVLLLLAATLLLRSFERLMAVDPGFDPKGVLTFQVQLPEARYAPEQRAAFFTELERSLQVLPEVVSVGMSPWMPLDPGWVFSYYVVGTDVPQQERPSAALRFVNDEYFSTLGIAVRRGRVFDPHDDAAHPKVAVINETMARHAFGDEDPIGHKIVLGFGPPEAGEIEREIVGVVADVRMYNLARPAFDAAWIPHLQAPRAMMTVAVKAKGDPTALAPAVRIAVHTLDPALAVERIEPLSRLVTRSVGPRRFLLELFGAFAVLAVVLAAVGLYGVMAQAVAQRRREIGIRMALGADAGRIVGSVVGGGLLLAVAGVLLGAVASLPLGSALERFLYQISARDPLAFLIASAVLVGVAAVGSLVPARRAAATDPGTELRSE